ncbi:MAG TPA: DegV family protein [Dehalococcoidia bacterium]|nr:DegV family protein [Dehalococcoidia bacterium]
MPVAIVTDSVADLPPQVVQELNVTVIPLYVHFGKMAYRDGIDLTAGTFYEYLANAKTLPTTSVPSLGEFAERYDKLAEDTDEIMVITISSKLSATYEVASQAVTLVKKNCRIRVIDSTLAIMAQGLVVIRAAEAAQAGASLEEIEELVYRDIPRSEMRAAFSTLKYLARGGRIGKAQALLGSMLNVNPIIGLKDGEVFPFGRERSREKAIQHLCDFAASYTHIDKMAVEYAGSPDDSEVLIEHLSAFFPRDKIYISRAGPVIGTHTGPSLLLVAVLGDRIDADTGNR